MDNLMFFSLFYFMYVGYDQYQIKEERVGIFISFLILEEMLSVCLHLMLI